MLDRRTVSNGRPWLVRLGLLLGKPTINEHLRDGVVDHRLAALDHQTHQLVVTMALDFFSTARSQPRTTTSSAFGFEPRETRGPCDPGWFLKTNRVGTHRRYLGSSLFVCDECDRTVQTVNGGKYFCSGHLTREHKHVDRYVLWVIA